MKRLSCLLFGVAWLALPACGDNTSNTIIESEVNCTNNTDDDEDGMVDCADSDCAQNLACNPVENCTDAMDNDGDGDSDCDDSDCDTDVACHPQEDCGNAMDDDGDGDADCADTDCAFECQVEDCTNGIDDDSDTGIDCADEDCLAYCSDACAAPVNIQIPANIVGHTAGHENVTDGTCQTAFGGGGGNEVVYRVVPAQNGIMRVRLSSGTDLGVYILTTCGQTDSEIACSDNFFGGGQETLNLAVSAGQELFVVVDEFTSADTGSYTLGIDFRVIMCGDSIVDPGEQCDPPLAPTCSATCQFLPESLCNNLTDDDGDGLIDCQDSTCAGTTDCTSGTIVTGEACVMSNECRANNGDPLCLSETVAGWPSGFCTEFCDVATNDCNGDAFCSDAFRIPSGGVCLVECTTAADCRDGYGCVFVGEGSACVPDCTTDAQCPTVMHCSVPDGLCIPNEVCTGGVDEDFDGAIDCVDTDCADSLDCVETDCDDMIDNDMNGATDCADSDCDADAACTENCTNGMDDDLDGLVDCADSFCSDVAGCTDSCLGIIEFTVPGTVSGDNTGRANTFFSDTCFTGQVAGEVAYQVTPTADGVIRFTLTSDADLGLYVHAPECDVGAEITCSDINFGPGAKEIINVNATMGESFFVFVDGFGFFGAGAAGPYTLQAQLVVPEAGLCTDTIDNDLDGLIDCADTDCENDAACPFVGACMTPIVLVEGAATAGTTVGGSNVMQGSCTGDLGALEEVYSFTVPGNADGLLTITLSSASDQGLYVRSNCVSAGSQLACIDKFAGGTDEVIALDAAGGEQFTIFVDGFSLGNQGPFTITADFTTPEAGFCTDGLDNDGDLAIDCADTECAGDPACFNACAGAPAINTGNTAGDTIGGTDLISASCQLGGAPERIFSFTPAATGVLTAVLVSDADLGVIIQACGFNGSELDCADVDFGPAGQETATANVTSGVPVAIIVDGFAGGEEGPFTLDISVAP